MAINPTKCRLRKCTIKGVDARLHTNCISVYETMCKPYLTATIKVIDNINFINGLNLQRGDKIEFAFDGGGRVYESVQYILDIPREESTEDNLRSMVYEIATASESYFVDKANLVQRSDVNVPGTAVAGLIHNQFFSDAPLKMLSSSLGMIAKTEIGGFVTANKKPFKAIEDVLKTSAFAGFKSGSPVYFRDRDSYVIAPLEQLFATMGAQETFYQKDTWGSEWHHTFTATNAIIAAKTVLGENSGRSGASNVTAAAKGAMNMFDISKGIEVLNKAASAAGGVGGAISKFASGNRGGIQNVLQTDSRRNELSSEQGINAVAENMFQAQVKDGTNYLVKVPIQSGINVTVGKGVNVKLIPPVGDQNSGAQNIGGLCLVADVMHQCFFDNREVQGTTTMRVVKKDYNS